MNTELITTFIKVFEQKSFSEAAKSLSISRSLCSMRISRLESELGCKLLIRSTRSLKPTEVGSEYYHKVKKAIDMLEHIDLEMRNSGQDLHGTITVHAPISYTNSFLTEFFVQFLKENPSVHLIVQTNDAMTQLSDTNFDIIFRIGQTNDSSLIFKKLGTTSRFMVASPQYLENNGFPQTLSELRKHNILYYDDAKSSVSWSLKKDGKIQEQKIVAQMVSNNGDVLLQAALSDLGITILPEFLVGKYLYSGQLVRLFSEYDLKPLPVGILYRSGCLKNPVIKAFITALSDWHSFRTKN